MALTRQDVYDAMTRRDRKRFLPSTARFRAWVNAPIPIGHGQTNSQPSTVVDMIVLLDIQPGQNVLDVGSGSGWTTAILGDLVGEHGRVTATELVSELADRARAVIDGEDLPWVTIYDADPDVLGCPRLAPYDRILVSAEARELPDELVDQLADGGVMVIPVDTHMLKVVKEAGSPAVTHHGRYSFVPLIGS